MKIKDFGMLALGLFVATTLGAQEQRGFDIGGNFSFAADSLKEITNKNSIAGFGLEGGYTGYVPGSTVGFRSGLAVNYFPGRDRTLHYPIYNSAGYVVALGDYQAKTALTLFQAFGDVHIATGFDKLMLAVGVSVNKWQTDNALESAYETENMRKGTHSVKGVKLGGRIGLEYAITQNLRATAMFQTVELGTDPLGTRGYNPSWLQFGVRYGF